MNSQSAESPYEITRRELGFLKGIEKKYSQPSSPLFRSLAIFTLMIVIAHAIEQTALPGWAAFGLIYLPAIFLFHRYRKFAIFKTRIMRKLAWKAGIWAKDGQDPPTSSIENEAKLATKGT